MDTTADEAAQVIALLQSGMRQCDVAPQLNLSRFRFEEFTSGSWRAVATSVGMGLVDVAAPRRKTTALSYRRHCEIGSQMLLSCNSSSRQLAEEQGVCLQ
jgi:hypothetical protein